MTADHASLIPIIAQHCSIPSARVERTVRLLEEGATVPFISRYRKEATGGLDEVQVGEIESLFARFSELEKRKATVLSAIAEQGRLTPELRSRIERCYDPVLLEDLYLPYKPKRRTRATAAKEKGLEPLADLIMRQDGAQPQRLAARFVRNGVATPEEALAGAGDIIAERISENDRSRSTLRRLFARSAELVSKVVKGKEQEGAKYADYFGMSEPLGRIPSHRLLAMIRGEKEGFLKIALSCDDLQAEERLGRLFVRGNTPARPYMEAAIRDGYKRLLKPSIENELLAAAKRKADREAIRVFAANLRQLLLAAPLGRKRVLAVDPGFRSGCKVVCLDGQGDLLHNETIYPHPPHNREQEAADRLRSLIEEYRIEAIAIGDGTAGRETERLFRKIRLPQGVQAFMVSEDGASVYSASATGREEFPRQDVTVRGAVSIGRRLIDPLAELVKIDPKSIGVGQYQHDVDQTELKNELDRVVVSCVNGVGVDLNTASRHLLTYVSGLGESLARNIVEYRTANGAFASRRELLNVPRLGAKAFEQCAGFLRIPGAADPLDNSAVHPESYPVVERMASDLGVGVNRLLADRELRQSIDPARYVTEKTGLPTLNDILKELDKPGRDPRERIRTFEFADIHTIEELKEGMILPGIVTNITAFGVFVDIGIKQQGLVHISQLADRFVSDPSEAVGLHRHVFVKVMNTDLQRNRIALSMRGVRQEQ